MGLLGTVLGICGQGGRCGAGVAEEGEEVGGGTEECGEGGWTRLGREGEESIGCWGRGRQCPGGEGVSVY